MSSKFRTICTILMYCQSICRCWLTYWLNSLDYVGSFVFLLSLNEVWMDAKDCFFFQRQYSVSLSELLIFASDCQGIDFSFGGGKCCVCISVNFSLVWLVLQYDWWMRVRLYVCVCGSRVAVVTKSLYSKDVYRYPGVSSNSVTNIILATRICLYRTHTRAVLFQLFLL